MYCTTIISEFVSLACCHNIFVYVLFFITGTGFEMLDCCFMVNTALTFTV